MKPLMRLGRAMFSGFFSLLSQILTMPWWLWIIGMIIGSCLLALGWWLHWEVDLVSPISEQSTFRFLTGKETPASTGKIVYGFLPYWNMSSASIHPEMTHLGYFALDITADGSIRTRDADGNIEPGYNRLGNDQWFEIFEKHMGSSADTNNPTKDSMLPEKRVELVFTQFSNDDIAAFVTSKTAQKKFITALDNLLLAYPVSGVNIDIEYSGEVNDSLRNGLTSFMADLHSHLKSTYEDISLSIDMYAGAGTSYTIWDIAALGPHTDYVVVMAYDFHRRQSIIAGPVAPLFGGKEYWDSDISANLQGFLKHIPGEKILLGVPFYGYEWKTTTRQAQAHTFPNTGATATYKRVQEVLAKAEELEVQEHWNEAALSPYISYKKDGDIFVIYYENSRSLSYKLDFVNQLDLAGIAIWALGYEGDSRELWEVIGRKL